MENSDKPDAKDIASLLNRLLRDSKEEEEVPKKMKDYKFWRTQPVPSIDDNEEKGKEEKSGPIDSTKTVDDIPNDPLPIHKEFYWDTIDLNNDENVKELYDLLDNNYVEDADSTLRFSYKPEFLRWALTPPGWKREWHVCVRVVSSKRLVAFISAIPVSLHVRSKNAINAVEINFLCVHKKLRSKRMAPLLIKEITRRVNKCNIWQALYTAGTVLPTPVSTCRYFHRALNWEKLYRVGFSPILPGKTKAQTIKSFALPDKTDLPGLRRMRETDIDSVYDLLNNYLINFDLYTSFTKDEIKHWFGPFDDNLKDSDRVVWSYVVEDEKTKKLTDFFSFYRLSSSAISPRYKNEMIDACYLFYYSSEKAISSKINKQELQSRLIELINAALIIAKNAKFDVFNTLSLSDNPLFLDKLKFGRGDGYLNYYLFNYRTQKINGGLLPNMMLDLDQRSGVGTVML